MKQFLIFVVIAISSIFFADAKKTKHVEEKKEINGGIYDDLTSMYVNFSQIPFAREGDANLYKYNVYSTRTHFRSFDNTLGIEFSIYYFETGKGTNKKSINSSDGQKDYEMSKHQTHLLIPNDPSTFDNLASELNRTVYGTKTIIFNEITETIYIFINLHNYKGAVKVTQFYKK